MWFLFCRDYYRSSLIVNQSPVSLRVRMCRTGWHMPIPHGTSTNRTLCRDRGYTLSWWHFLIRNDLNSSLDFIFVVIFFRGKNLACLGLLLTWIISQRSLLASLPIQKRNILIDWSHFLWNKELEEELAEQKKLLKSVASHGEEILNQQASPSSARSVSLSEENLTHQIVVLNYQVRSTFSDGTLSKYQVQYCFTV